MNSSLHQFLYGIYPYVALAVFLLGSLARYDREQYSWRSESSQLLKRGQLRLGSNLFHIGIIGLFFGHFAGLLTPVEVYHSFGLSSENKQVLAIVVGNILGTMCLVGLLVLIHRRWTEPRIRALTRPMDFVVLGWILVTLCLGLITTWYSWHHRAGDTMIALASWAQHIVTFRGGAADFIAGVDTVYKVHLFFGMTLFLLFPFSRLVHIWSGFATVTYLFRPYQVVRRRSQQAA